MSYRRGAGRYGRGGGGGGGFGGRGGGGGYGGGGGGGGYGEGGNGFGGGGGRGGGGYGRGQGGSYDRFQGGGDREERGQPYGYNRGNNYDSGRDNLATRSGFPEQNRGGAKEKIPAVPQDEWQCKKILRPFPGADYNSFYCVQQCRSDREVLDVNRLAARQTHMNFEGMNRIGRWVSMYAASFVDGAKAIMNYVPGKDAGGQTLYPTGLLDLQRFFSSSAGTQLLKSMTYLDGSRGDAKEWDTVLTCMEDVFRFLTQRDNLVESFQKCASFSVKAYVMSVNSIEAFACLSNRQHWAEELHQQHRMMPSEVLDFIRDPGNDGAMIEACAACYMEQVASETKSGRTANFLEPPVSAPHLNEDGLMRGGGERRKRTFLEDESPHFTEGPGAVRLRDSKFRRVDEDGRLTGVGETPLRRDRSLVFDDDDDFEELDSRLRRRLSRLDPPAEVSASSRPSRPSALDRDRQEEGNVQAEAVEEVTRPKLLQTPRVKRKKPESLNDDGVRHAEGGGGPPGTPITIVREGDGESHMEKSVRRHVSPIVRRTKQPMTLERLRNLAEDLAFDQLQHETDVVKGDMLRKCLQLVPKTLRLEHELDGDTESDGELEAQTKSIAEKLMEIYKKVRVGWLQACQEYMPVQGRITLTIPEVGTTLKKFIGDEAVFPGLPTLEEWDKLTTAADEESKMEVTTVENDFLRKDGPDEAQAIFFYEAALDFADKHARLEPTVAEVRVFLAPIPDHVRNAIGMASGERWEKAIQKLKRWRHDINAGFGWYVACYRAYIPE